MADYRLHQTGDEIQDILDNATPQSELTAETERAQQAENQLQQNINSEQNERQQADITLQQHIDAEAQTRQQGDTALNQLIQQVQTSLINYYLKTETYSANQIDQMLAAIKQFRYQVVDQLPTPSADTMGIIYLVPSAHAVSGNIKDEYITLTRDEGSGIIYYFEQIGETAIDLSNYYTKAQTNAEITNALNTALANYSTTQQMNTAIANAIAAYYTKAQVDALIANFITASVNNLVNYYLKSETFNKTEVQQMIAAVKQFRYQVAAELPTASVDTVGIIYLIPSTNPQQKNVKDEFITIATTEQGSTTYSWEQIGSTEVDLSGYSTTEQMNAAIASAITTALAPYYTAEQVNAAISTALSDYYTKTQTDTAITTALNAALASYSTTEQMNAAITAAIANYYTKAQVDALIADFITASVNNLVNYYLKSETYSKDEVNQLIGELSSLRFEVADSLPEATAATLGAIYLVPGSSPTVQNIKDEYITLKRTEGGVDTYYWELIGSTAVDLSNYFTKDQTNAAITAALNAALADYSTTQQMNATIATAIANYYTKQEVDALIADFITASVNNLVNYYLKSDTYTKAEVQQLIAAIKQFTYQSVVTLPTASADTMNIIYLVPSSDPKTQNVKDEYITIATTEQDVTTYSWEKIGSTDIDLSGYYTSAQTDAAITAALNAALADYSTTQQMNAAIATAIAGYYTKQEVDALIANFITKSVDDLVNYYLKSDTYTKTEVQQMIDAVKQFTYMSVTELPTASAGTMNKIYLVPSTNPKTKNVKDEFITISATDQGTTTYSWEQIGSTEIDLSGYYTSQQTDAAISTALASYYTKTQTDTAITTALNTALADYSTTQQMATAIAQAIANYYTKQEVDALIANFITKSVDDLVNYYLKSDTYTKTEVQQLIDAVKQFTYMSVSELPTASADTMNKIYLVPSTNPKTKNVKDEFITISATDQGTTTYSWEQIGSTEIDLSGYYTSQQTDAAISTALQSYSTTTQMNTAITTALNAALADYSTTQQMTAAIATAIANYYTKQEVDALIANFITKSVDDLVNYYLKSDTYTKAEVQQLIAAIKQFTYQSVQSLPTASADTMNIIYLVPSADPKTQNVKDEYITIATTDQDVTTYSWEKIGSTDIDLSGYYTSTQTDAAISAALASYSTTSQMTTAINTAVSGKQNAITDGAIIGLGYGVCSTAAATPAKEVTIANFLLLANMPITVKFTNSITVANVTLNISLTGAKPLFMEGTALNPYVVRAGMIATIIYDGTNYNIVQLGYAKNTLSSHIVDMGLPSGTLWSDANIDITQSDGFAASEFQYECSFFSWGNIAGHNPISESAFSYDFGSNNSGPYASTPGSQLSGNVPVNPMYDIARAICGDPWRMPTATEFQELIDNCDFVQADGETVVSGSNKLVTVNNIVGIYLKSKINGNLLFFPCSGYGNGTSWNGRATSGNYWSGSLASDTTKGLDLGFGSGGVYPQYSSNRFYGLTGRAVQKVD